jgi:hypothetical protein
MDLSILSNHKPTKEKRLTMRTNILKLMCVFLLVLGLSFGGSVAWAENGDSNPAGWSKGEKKGWSGEMPPGLEKKETGKGEKIGNEMRKVENETEREAEKVAREAEYEARKAGKEAKREMKKPEGKSGVEKSKAEKETARQKLKAERETKRQALKAEKEAKWQKMKAEKEAKKKQREAEKEMEEAKKSSVV